MDITKSNFDSSLPIIFDAIDNCDFAALDLEFSYLPPGRPRCSSEGEYYSKWKSIAQNSQPMSVGLSFFRFDSSLSVYHIQCFNIYCFPSSIEGMSTSSFCVSSGSIDFLKE